MFLLGERVPLILTLKSTYELCTLPVFSTARVLDIIALSLPIFYRKCSGRRLLVKRSPRCRSSTSGDQSPLMLPSRIYSSPTRGLLEFRIWRPSLDYYSIKVLPLDLRRLHFSERIAFKILPGISVILEELLKMARILINDKLKRHLRTIYSVMPKLCKLPRSDYGSPGAS